MRRHICVYVYAELSTAIESLCESTVWEMYDTSHVPALKKAMLEEGETDFSDRADFSG